MSIDLVLPLQESLRELRRGHQWVTECLEQTMGECEQRGAELAECRQQLAEVRRSLFDCERLLADKSRAEAEALRNWEQLREQESGNRAELKAAQDELKLTRADVESTRNKLQSAFERQEQMQAECQRLTADVENGRAELKDLRLQFAPLLESASEAAKLRGQLESAQAELVRVQEHSGADETELKHSLAASETARQELQSQLGRILEESEGTRAELSQLREKISAADETKEFTTLREQLEAISADLARWHAIPEQSEAEERLRDDLVASETARQDLQSQLARLLRESEGTRQELNDLREQFSPVTEGYAEMAQIRGQLSTVHAELARLAEQSTEEPPTDSLRQQLSDADHQRELLESELDQVRQRGAELSDALAEQKRIAADERQRWADELRQLRGAVDRQSELLGQRPTGPPPAPGEELLTTTQSPPEVAPRAASPANNNRVLDSVLEQFEKIQRNKVRKLATS